MASAETLCRICTKEKSPMVSILDNNPLNLQEKLNKLLKIKISENSKLPKRICIDCLTKLNNFNEFYVQSHENQVILQVIFSEKPEPTTNAEISTQTDDPVKASQEERYFIIEELTEGNESQQISIVAEDELLEQENQEEHQMDLTIEHEEYDVTIKDENISRVSLDTPTKKKKFDRYDCYICEKHFSGNYLYIKHFAQEHPGQEIRYRCYVCKHSVKKYRSYTRHLESHVQKRFECDICNFKFSQKITLMSHMSSHSNVKNFKCPDCDLSFKQNSSLFKHRKQKHSNDVPTCTECNKTFVNKMTFQQHMKSRHDQGSKDIACEHCDKKFASKSALFYHKISNHPGDDAKPVKCELCNEDFKNVILLGRHKQKRKCMKS